MGNMLKFNAAVFNSSMETIESEMTAIKDNLNMLQDRVSRIQNWKGEAKTEWQSNAYAYLEKLNDCMNETIKLAKGVNSLGKDLSKAGNSALRMLDGFITALI